MVVVVAQLVEGSLPMPEVRGSNPVIGKILIEQCLLSNKCSLLVILLLSDDSDVANRPCMCLV